MKSVLFFLLFFPFSVHILGQEIEYVPDKYYVSCISKLSLYSLKTSSEPLVEDENYIYTDVTISSRYLEHLGSLQRFLADNIIYPKKALKNKIQGRVCIKYIVEKDGSISNLTIQQDIGKNCGKEFLRVLKLTSGKWKPATKEGKDVRSYCLISVDFTLPKEK